jgi:peptidyl-prolyl cis-trans isomerase D
MLQTDSGFTVTVLDKVIQPTPAQDPQDYGQVRTALARELQDDLASSFVVALQNRDHVSVDQKLFAQIYQ